MNVENKYRLSHSDFKEIVKFINENYNFDFSVYSYSITKRRIEKFLLQYSVFSIDSAKHLLEKEKFWESLLDSFFIETTEIFRDVEVWQKLKEKYISKLHINPKLKIWVPDITTDDELLTLIIVLKEMNIENFEILASSKTERIKAKFDTYRINQKKYDVSTHNYKNYSHNEFFQSCFIESKAGYVFRQDLLSNVLFQKICLISEPTPVEYFDLVVFRNRMLYYDIRYFDTILEKVTNAVKPGGIFIFGVKENIITPSKFKLSEADKELKFYIKKK